MSYSAVCKDWTQSIVANTTIEAADTNEFKTNIDWIKDNLACVSHNATYQATHYTSNNATAYGDNWSAVHALDQTSHYGTYEVTHHDSYFGTHDADYT